MIIRFTVLPSLCRYWLLAGGLMLWCCRGKTPAGTLFSELPPAQTGVAFANRVPEQTPDGAMNIVQYLYYYNGGGVAVGDVNNDGLPDLYFGSNLEHNRLYLNKGNFQFEDVTEKAGVGGSGSWKTGVGMADVNADGWLDIYVCQVGNYKTFHGKNQLFVNNHDGTFTERAAEYGLDLSAFCTQAVFFDYDRDNDLDCFILCHSVHSPESYKDTSVSRQYDALSSDRLYRCDGSPGKPVYTDVTAQSGLHDGKSGYGLGVAVGDLNQDGFPDIYVTNDFHENDYLYYNTGGKFFQEGSARSMGHTSNFSMGCDMADVNNDALPDIVSLDMKPEEEQILKASQPADQYPVYAFKHSYGYHWQFPRNNLQLNRGVPPSTVHRPPSTVYRPPSTVFAEIGQYAGIAATDWSWSALLADFDLDGWKDLYITNGIPHRPNDMDYIRFTSSAEVQRQASDLDLVAKMPPGAAANYAFRNTADLRFENVSRQWGLNQTGFSNGAAYADLDNDGDLDLVVNNLNAPASLLKNQTSGRNYLKVKLKGPAGNPFATGAKVAIEAANGLRQLQELQPVRGFQSSGEPLLLFGLDTLKNIATLRVTWPDGTVQQQNNVAANQTLSVQYKNAPPLPQGPGPMAGAPLFSPAPTGIIHHAGGVDDITREKLLPWSAGTQSPRWAVADVNGDGRADLYLPGANGGQLFLQTPSGFSAPQTLMRNDFQWDETCAAFFDANGDGAPDLFIGTGGNHYAGRHPGLADFLLLNDGHGHFSRPAEGLLPEMFENTACARPADVDGDGDLDLFVGNYSVTNAYGLAPRSYLLLNDGHGRFSDGTPPALEPAMITDARWADADGDGRPDLLLCGEWMPLTILLNTANGFVKQEIPHSAGLWNCLAVADLDRDGDPDLLAGNFGLNSNLQASAAEPLGLWVKDFDQNGSTDPVLTYFRQGKNCVLADKDWLTGQLPSLKKRFVQYHAYAQSTFDDVFPAALRAGATHRSAEILASCRVENLGKGGWALHPLPAEAQFSPVFALLPGDFDGDGQTDVLTGGNLYEIQPGIGRQDANSGVFLRGDGKGGFAAVSPAQSGYWPQGAVRILTEIPMAGGQRRVLVGVHDGAVQGFLIGRK